MKPLATPLSQLPHVWRGRELASAQEQVLPTGHGVLDGHLPGGGWPLGNLVEVLQQDASRHVWQLLGPALASAVKQGDPALLVHPPYQPFGPSLRAQGIAPERMLCVHTDSMRARLWAAEQALRCADVSAVLAWIPQARSEDLRRLHLTAQGGPKLLVVFRPASAREQSSPARLRLLVQGTDQLEVVLLKRRGPPLLQPLVLRSQTPLLSSLLAARSARRAGTPLPTPGSHVLDRTPSLAG